MTQPLLCSAAGLPEGARYFGFIIPGRPPTLAESGSTVPSGRAVLYVADLIGESRMFGGRRWSPILNAPAEVLELIDAANGQLVTVVRAAFLPDPPSSSTPREPSDRTPASQDASTSIASAEKAGGDMIAGLSLLPAPGARLLHVHGKRRSSLGTVPTRPHRRRQRRAR